MVLGLSLAGSEGKPVIAPWLSLGVSIGEPLLMVRGLSLAGSKGRPVIVKLFAELGRV